MTDSISHKWRRGGPKHDQPDPDPREPCDLCGGLEDPDTLVAADDGFNLCPECEDETSGNDNAIDCGCGAPSCPCQGEKVGQP